MNRCLNDIIWGCCNGKPVVEDIDVSRTDDEGVYYRHKCHKSPKTCGKYVACAELCSKLANSNKF